MDVKKLIIIICGVVVVALLVVGVIFLPRACSSPDDSGALAEQRRLNMLGLAQIYIDEGEFDLALNVIRELLIENLNDEEARAMQRVILGRERGSELGGADSTEALLELLEEQLRQNRALAENLQRGGSSAQNIEAEIMAARRLAEAEEERAQAAARRRAAEAAAEQERAIAAEQRAAEQRAQAEAQRLAAEERERELAEMRRQAEASAQAAAEAIRGVSAGAESVEALEGDFDLD